MSELRWVDAHCHLESDDFPDLGAVIDAARAAGVERAVVVGQLQKSGDWGNAVAVARERPDFLVATLGIHPHNASLATEEDLRSLEAQCALPEIRAVGEAGLDYYYDHSPRERQAEVFRFQCRLARAVKKPLVIHVRDAHEECAAILREEGVDHGVIHCFTGDLTAARAYLALGFHISLSGIVTYKKTEALHEAVRFAPLERLLVETDSPYLAPIPHRGKKNTPALVVETAKKVAELKGVSLEELSLRTTENARRVFRL